MVNIITKKEIKNLLPVRKSDSHKGTFGRVLNIAGSSLYPGAAYLSSYSALKAGAGYVTLASAAKVCDYVSLNAPEVTFIPLKADETGAIARDNKIETQAGYNVIAAGCGLSTGEETKDFLISVLNNRNDEQKIVLDADALNIIAKYSLFDLLKNTLITPHPKELSRLAGVPVDEINENREKYAVLTAERFDCTVLLKGHRTIITDGNDVFVNVTGNSALAKAGSGDVLTGFIAGLAAQGLSLFNAAKAGAFIHGLAGEFASYALTEYGVCASDVAQYVSEAFKEIMAGE